MFTKYSSALREKLVVITRAHAYFDRLYMNIERSVVEAINTMNVCVPRIQEAIILANKEVAQAKLSLKNAFPLMKKRIDEVLARTAKLLEAYDPLRQLKLGYSLLRRDGNVLRSIKGVKIGDTIEATVADGLIITSTTKLIYNDKETNNQ
jgi:exonuclease VII large subunit